MANGAALIRESLWHDRDFRSLPRTVQCLYLQLLSQKDLDCAGILTLNRDVLTKGCDEMSLTDLDSDLKALSEARFIVVDTDTDEVLIRTYIRHVSVKSPKVWVAAKSAVKRSRSPEIRAMLASELLRLGRADAKELANLLQACRYPIDTVSEPHQYPIDTPYPIDTVSIPTVPVPVPVPVSSHVDGWVGRAPEGAPTCPQHPDGPKHDEPCRTCKQIRQHTARLQAAAAEHTATQKQNHRTAIDNCEYCDDKGLREINDDTQTRCNHQPETFTDERTPF